MRIADWIDSGAGFALDVATVLGGAAALLVLAAAARAWYRRTPGRRRDRYDRLARLATGAQLSFFIAVLGEPPAMRKTIDKNDFVEIATADDPDFDPALADPDELAHEVIRPHSFTECFFLDRDYFVQTISDYDDTVLAYSVTTRRRRFAPTFETPARFDWLDRWRWRRRFGGKYTPLFKIRLGRTRFADLDPNDPDDFAGPHFKVAAGARSFAYSELHYFGNPGLYQTFVFTASSAAWDAPAGLAFRVVEEIHGEEEWPSPETNDLSWEDMPATQRFRRETVITTYTVIGGDLWERNYPSSFGPHGDEVRTLP